MSMHEIEGLIEDSVRLMAKSKLSVSVKRDFLYNLYNFQNRFDTGYTHFRLIDILLELKFTYRIPLEKHPDFEKNKAYFNALNVENTYWIPSKIGEKGESVYAKKDDKGIFIYADAGSEFWKRLCQEEILPKAAHTTPEKFKDSLLISRILKETEKQDDLQLMSDWYAFLVNSLGNDLEEEEGFPKKFLEFTERDEVNEIRQIGLKHKLFSNDKNNNDWGNLETPVLKEIEEIENDIERYYCTKWLLDFKTDEAKIIKEYEKAITPDPKKKEKLQIVPDAVKHHLGSKNWKLVWESKYDHGYQWLYYQKLNGKEGEASDTDVHGYLFFDANTEDLKILYPKIGVQHGILNRWQDRGVVHRPESIHFLESLAAYIPSKDWDTNKSLHYMGGWKFSLKSSEKTLKKHVDNYFAYFDKYGPKLLKEFEKPLFNNFEMSVDEAFAYRAKMQQTHRFFLNKIEVYLAYAIHYFENDDMVKAKQLAKQAKEFAVGKKHPIAKYWAQSAESILISKPKLNELLSFEGSYF